MSIDTVPPPAPAPPEIPLNPNGETGDPTPEIVVPDLKPGETGTATATKANKSVECSTDANRTDTTQSGEGCDLPVLTPGKWSVSATVTDLAGNESAPSEPVEVTIVRVGLPDDTESLGAVSVAGAGANTTVSANLKPSELGKVATVIFVVRNADGSIARTIRVTAPTLTTKVLAKIKGLTRGQRVDAYTENWFGVSRRAPRGSNVVRARTARQFTKSGVPRLLGATAGVSRIIFDPASVVLDAQDKANLDVIANRVFDKGGLVLVSGFARQNLTDSKRFLTDLSVARAEAVAKYLSAKGVRAWIRYDGYGAVTKRVGTWEDRKVEIRWAEGVSELPAK
jgi:outer membrane protein OmpA-like peptidoglycan-associated protein